MAGDVADGGRAPIDRYVTLDELTCHSCVIGRSDLVERQIGDHFAHRAPRLEPGPMSAGMAVTGVHAVSA